MVHHESQTNSFSMVFIINWFVLVICLLFVSICVVTIHGLPEVIRIGKKFAYAMNCM